MSIISAAAEPALHVNGKFVCNICCENGKMMCDPTTGDLIFICEDHMRLILHNGKVFASQTLGVRH